jgi:hypothetical protein
MQRKLFVSPLTALLPRGGAAANMVQSELCDRVTGTESAGRMEPQAPFRPATRAINDRSSALSDAGPASQSGQYTVQHASDESFCRPESPRFLGGHWSGPLA